jgi:hypothetical protein
VVDTPLNGRRVLGFRVLAPLLALGFLLVMFISGAPPTHGNRIEAQADGLLTHEPAAITAAEINWQGMHSRFLRRGGHWLDADGEVELSASRVQALEAGIKFMHTAAPVRTLAPEATASIPLDAYGLQNPEFDVTLLIAGKIVLRARFGNRANGGILQYMKADGGDATYLMSGFVGETWAKLRPPKAAAEAHWRRFEVQH